MDFSSCVGSQLKYLVQSLSKQNFNSNAVEVDKLLLTFGTEATRFLLGYLVQEVQSNNLLDSSQRESLKLRLLNLVLGRLPKETNFISLASEMLDEVHLGGEKGTGSKCDFLMQLCRALNLPLVVQLAAGLGLSHSHNPAIQKEGIQFLKNKLGEVTANVVKTLPENVLHHLLHFVSTTEVFTESERTLLNLESLRQSLLSLNSIGASAKEITSSKKKRDFETGRLATDLGLNLSLATIMSEMGYVATSSKQFFLSLLEQFPALSAAEIAEVVGLMAMKHSGEDDSSPEVSECFYNLDMNSAFRESNSPQPCTAWNSEIFVTCINEKYTINWRDVFRSLDYPAFTLTSQRGLAVILTLYKKATGEAMPVEPLLGLWTNRAGQLSFLQLLPQAPPDLVDWVCPSGQKVNVDDLPTTLNHVIWSNMLFTDTLLKLADHECYVQVRQVFEFGLKSSADLILLALVQAETQRTELQKNLIHNLLPLYILGTVGTPHSAVVLPHLMKVAPESLAQGLTSVAADDPNMLNNVVTLSLENNWIETLLEYSPKPAIVVNAAILAACRGKLSMGEWLNKLFNNSAKSIAYKGVMAKALIKLVESKLRGATDKGAAAGESSSLPMDVVEEIFKAMFEAVAKQTISMEDQLRALLREARTVYSKLQVDDATQALASAPAEGGLEQTDFAKHIEEEANNYFGSTFSGKMSVEELFELLHKFKNSTNQREVDVYNCMIHNLFDEYRFFAKYPEKELQITARIFGGIVAHDVLSQARLGTALRFVLQACANSCDKMRQFGAMALDQFKHRLPDWTQYCRHLQKVPDLPQLLPGIEQYLTASNGGAPPSPGSARAAEPARSPSPQSLGGSGPAGATADKSSSGPAGGSEQFHLSGHAGASAPAPAPRPQGEPASFGHTYDIATLLTTVPKNAEVPQEIADKIAFLMNNLMEANLDNSVTDFKKFLRPEHTLYLGQYLVVKRVSLEPNNHKLYLSLLEKLGMKDLDQHVLQFTYGSTKALLASEKTRTSTAERSLLKNLGAWLGHLTIARNKPLLTKNLNLKDLIFEAMETGQLIAVLPFVAKVMEHCATSKIFRPPNPWMMGIVILMVELHQMQDLKLTLKFEVEVLCKNINVNMQEILQLVQKQKDKSNQARLDEIRAKLDVSTSADFQTRTTPAYPPPHRMEPPKDMGSMDPTMTGGMEAGQFGGGFGSGPMGHMGLGQSEGMPGMGGPMGGPPGLPGGSQLPPSAGGLPGVPVPAAGMSAIEPETPEQIRLTHQFLPNMVQVSPNIQLIKSKPSLKAWIAFAIDRAVVEIIQPVVERAVMIACTTTRELVIKDFATDNDDAKMRQCAHMMVQNLASNLATVTCKVALRVTMTNQLRGVLSSKVLAEAHDRQAQDAISQACDVITRDNLDLGVNLVKKTAADEAIREIDNSLQTAMEERAKARELQVPYMPRSAAGEQFACQQFFATLPDALRPKQGGIMGQHKRVYDDFAVTLQTETSRAPEPAPEEERFSPTALQALQTLQNTLNEIEREATNHYRNNPPTNVKSILSLTHSSFTQGTQSPEHERIKELVVGIHPLIREDTALLFARDIFSKVFSLSDKIIAEQKTPAQQPSAELYVLMLVNEVCLFVCQTAREKNPPAVTQELTRLFLGHEKRWQHKFIAVNFVRLRLINMQEFDKHLSEILQNPDAPNARQVVEFAGSVVQRCLVDEQLITQKDLKNTLEILGKIAKAPQSAAPQSAAAAAAATPAVPAKEVVAPGAAAPGPVTSNHPAEQELRATVAKLFREWIAICSGSYKSPDGSHQALQQQAMAFIGKLQQHGMLKAIHVMDKFFALLMEMSVEFCVQELAKQAAKEAAENEEGKKDEDKKEPWPPQNSHFLTVDAFSDLIVLLIKCCGRGGREEKPKKDQKEGQTPNSIQAEVTLLTKVLAVVSRVLMEEHDAQTNAFMNGTQSQLPWSGFHQQAYFRFFSDLLIAFNQAQGDDTSHNQEVLTVFSHTLLVLSPSRLPGFAFSWLELISHRMFMPKLLLAKNQTEGWVQFQKLMVACLKFLEPSLATAQLTDAIRLFYRGTLKILLALLHDFPEFLCSYHFSFCDVIPPCCIQLRNVILSSFPRHMRLPDPFTPNLKVDLLPEITQSPRILSKFMEPTPGVPQVITAEEIDLYLKKRQPAGWLQDLPNKLKLSPAQAAQTGFSYNIPLINSLVLYVGVQALAMLQAGSGSPSSIGDGPAMDIYLELAVNLDPEGRYLFLNALANHLRYPNNHTHYFSCVVLHLFAEAQSHQEIIQEQITRVLLERLIVNRPHPWGLLITFIELVKNPLYDFWKKVFIHCSPEIERLFENVGQSCLGNMPKQRLQQQGAKEASK